MFESKTVHKQLKEKSEFRKKKPNFPRQYKSFLFALYKYNDNIHTTFNYMWYYIVHLQGQK